MNLPISEVAGQPLTNEQTHYLTGFFSGAAARGLRFSDVEANPASTSRASSEDLILEERIKRELHPLDAYPTLLEHAVANKAPDREDTFRFKWNGLFFLTPNKEAYMARLRIPGGVLQTYQLREIVNIARELTTGYIQITTRANLQIRLIQPKDAPAVLTRIQHVGLHTRGSGADNIRNLTANPTAGIDPHEIIDVLPYCREMGQLILNDRAFYDLPRKFNIAYDGGGLIGSVADTNDIGATAVKVGDEVFFRIALGGATGHKAFARDAGILVKPADLNKVIAAMVRVYIANGNRGDRKKARLKHLLETWTLERYVGETEKLLGTSLTKNAVELESIQHPSQQLPHSHVGVYPQKQSGLFYVGVSIPVGLVSPKQLLRIAEIADLYGTGEIRLTVWQNFIIPNIAEAYVATVRKALRRIGFDTEQSHLRSGIIACTGNSYCKLAQANTKDLAISLANYLDKKLTLDQPVNIHVTGCPNSCAQHYMGDIGLLGTKTKLHGEPVEAYHVFVGGGFGKNQAIGRQVFAAMIAETLKPTLERMLRVYLQQRDPGETFQAFTSRHNLNALQVLFS